MKPSIKLAGLAGVVALALAPAGAQASHCGNVVILSGTGAIANAGAAGCLDPAAHEDTNYLTPGATVARVRVLDDENPNTPAPFGGTITIGTTTIALTFTAGNGRWDSQNITLDPFARSGAAATVVFGEIPEDQTSTTVTYRSL